MAPSAQGIAIFGPLIIALPTTLGTIVIHGVAVIAIVHFVRHERLLGRACIRFWRDVIIVSGAALLALMEHLIEIAIWGLVFALCGEFTHLASAVYHSAVNYTSLGYGDVVMSARWRLLGPLETADGMLLFGVSAAMIFAVIQRLVQTRFNFEDEPPSGNGGFQGRRPQNTGVPILTLRFDSHPIAASTGPFCKIAFRHERRFMSHLIFNELGQKSSRNHEVES